MDTCLEEMPPCLDLSPCHENNHLPLSRRGARPRKPPGWTNTTGICVVAQNNEGNIMGGINRNLRSDNITIMEATTIHEVIRLAKEMRWCNITIEFNSQEVIQQI